MIEIVHSAIEHYSISHSKPETALLREVREFTMTQTTAPQMLSGPLEGNFLKMVVQMTGAKRVLELGTFTGYSALWMAQGLQPGGEIITCDASPEHAKIAQDFFDKSPYKNNIKIKLGAALDTIATLEGPFDVAFIDADKANYSAYYEKCMELIRPGGSILVDNTLWDGRVLNPQEKSDKSIHALNELIAKDPRVDSVLVTIRDGIQWARKK
ncbi:MAG: class I SAM-dependent methyltransferase [Proteobacteria bacterium]|nr:class I SAM-dependent methyltransferase [Pseudomonadota bacterium]